MSLSQIRTHHWAITLKSRSESYCSTDTPNADQNLLLSHFPTTNLDTNLPPHPERLAAGVYTVLADALAAEWYGFENNWGVSEGVAVYLILPENEMDIIRYFVR
jgi:hypothetical protein